MLKRYYTAAAAARPAREDRTQLARQLARTRKRGSTVFCPIVELSANLLEHSITLTGRYANQFSVIT